MAYAPTGLAQGAVTEQEIRELEQLEREAYNLRRARAIEQLRQEQRHSIQVIEMPPPLHAPSNAPFVAPSNAPARAALPMSAVASAAHLGLTQSLVAFGEEAIMQPTSYPDELFELHDYRPPQPSDCESD
jgi:hypothetical protein